MKNTDNNNDEADIGGIARKISDGLYININRIPTHHVDYEGDELEALGNIPDDETFEKIMNDNLRKKDAILPKDDKEQGNETIGIP
ncbi:hypothetical protein ACI6PS_14915 [Flavobacterium sp. PLA-1-15]|uniref:hypothetical protein n=1 Tax=Flavobacterium sp. PLA-1-15 TaxID=3380533 RepID=UPI003B78CF28